MCSLDEKIKKYRTNPAGIKDETDLQRICTTCGSKNVKSKNEKEHYIKICQDCKTEWYVNHCWNCSENVDSRDPQNPKCPECDWLKCSNCGACYIEGCKTNPYSKINKIKVNQETFLEPNDYYEDMHIDEMCDWCGIHPVSYRDSAYSLCESCSDQLFGD